MYIVQQHLHFAGVFVNGSMKVFMEMKDAITFAYECAKRESAKELAIAILEKHSGSKKVNDLLELFIESKFDELPKGLLFPSAQIYEVKGQDAMPIRIVGDWEAPLGEPEDPPDTVPIRLTEPKGSFCLKGVKIVCGSRKSASTKKPTLSVMAETIRQECREGSKSWKRRLTV